MYCADVLCGDRGRIRTLEHLAKLTSALFMAAQVCADSCPATTETDNDNMFLTPARPHTPTPSTA